MPAISHHFPGIHPGTVYDLPLHWWRVYLASMKAINAEAKKHTK